MVGRMIRGAIFGLLVALAWIAYRRGVFQDLGGNTRYGVGRMRQGIQVFGSQLREGIMKARHRAGEGLEQLGDSTWQRAGQVRRRLMHSFRM